MTSPRLHTVQCLSPSGLHTLAYREWGDPANPNVLVCVHGLTRVAKDFDALAQAMSDRYRVICPDVVGRGDSGWLKNPAGYTVPQYVSDMVTLLARINAEKVHWFGTSMGGLIGMGLASLPDSPIRRMVLNDVGPAINADAIMRIGQYLGQNVRYASFEEGAAYIRLVSASFGAHSEEEWHKFCLDVMRQDADGSWRMHYDLGLVIPFKAITPEILKAGEAMAWAAWDAIKCPVLVVRGAESDLLSRETVKQMQERGPKATAVELPGVGHAPTFVHADQIKLARDYLLAE